MKMVVTENSLNFYVKVNSNICMVAERCYEKWRPQLVNLVILLMTVMLAGVKRIVSVIFKLMVRLAFAALPGLPMASESA